MIRSTVHKQEDIINALKYSILESAVATQSKVLVNVNTLIRTLPLITVLDLKTRSMHESGFLNKHTGVSPLPRSLYNYVALRELTDSHYAAKAIFLDSKSLIYVLDQVLASVIVFDDDYNILERPSEVVSLLSITSDEDSVTLLDNSLRFAIKELHDLKKLFRDKIIQAGIMDDMKKLVKFKEGRAEIISNNGNEHIEHKHLAQPLLSFLPAGRTSNITPVRLATLPVTLGMETYKEYLDSHKTMEELSKVIIDFRGYDSSNPPVVSPHTKENIMSLYFIERLVLNEIIKEVTGVDYSENIIQNLLDLRF